MRFKGKPVADRRILFCAFVLVWVALHWLSSPVSAQEPAAVKAYDLATGESRELGGLPAGKLWFDKARKTLYLHSGNQIKSYSVDESRLSEKGTQTLVADRDNDLSSQRLKRFWRLKVSDDDLCYAGGNDGKSLYVGDLKGNVHFFDMKGRYYLGKLNFGRKRLQMIKPLSDESLLLFYDGGHVLSLKRYRAPVLSSLQRLKDSYPVAGRVKLPFEACQSIAASSSGGKAAFICDRRNIVVLDIPTMTVTAVIKEKSHVNFASFIRDEYLVYSREKQRDMSETPFETSFRPVMAPFFDWRNSITAPNEGDHFVMISGKNSLRLYGATGMTVKGDLIETAQNTGDIFFGQDGDTVFVLNAAKNRLSVYKP